METPRDYNLDHPEFRQHQLESILWGLQSEGFGTMEAPTGSGKTGVAKAISSRKSIIALCKTKNLQYINYDRDYGATALYGRANYKCSHPDALDWFTCEDCLYAEQGMHKCPYSNRCEYLLAKESARQSNFAVLNYAYWMTAKWPRENPPQVLYCDECHNLSETIIQFVSCTIGEADRVRYGLPDFPRIMHDAPNSLLNLPAPSKAALVWLDKARAVLRAQYTRYHKRATNSPKERKDFHALERLGMKIKSVMTALEQNDGDWYIRSGPVVLGYGHMKVPGFVAKPLTAKHDFGRFFDTGNTVLSVSATVGDPETFREELGIAEDRYDFRVVPNRYPPTERPVYVLDCPSMGGTQKADWELRAEKQAQEIIKFISVWPKTWSGLIHVTRKTEERSLRNRLARMGLGDRVYSIPGNTENYIPTDKQVRQWNEYRVSHVGALLVTCNFYEGYNGVDERINIAAKIPFPRMGDKGSYERAWMNHSMTRYLSSAAIRLAQTEGRTRRGEDSHYDIGGLNGAVAIADGSLGKVRKRLPVGIREALVEWS